MDFRWNECNRDHVAIHGVKLDEAEAVVRNAVRPYPRRIGGDKWITWGRGDRGRLLQVVFILDEDNSTYVIHARPLTETERRTYRRQTEK